MGGCVRVGCDVGEGASELVCVRVHGRGNSVDQASYAATEDKPAEQTRPRVFFN